VTTHEHPVSPAAWAEPSPIVRAAQDTWTIAEGELRKLRHEPSELLTRAVQPLLWLVVFGQIFASTRVIPTGSLSYVDYLAPGILAQSALFSAIFYGITVIWERDLGVLHKYLVSPASRFSLVAGKALAGGLRALAQAFVIYVAAAVMGVQLRLEILPLLGVAIVVVLGSAGFATFSLVVACFVKSRDRFMGLGQILTMPLFFLSSAVYPISIMPPLLQVVAHINPLTYQVDALRGLMIQGGPTSFPLLLDIGVLALTTATLLYVAARLYPRLAM
jgi:ABC-2 type transport system permease protein